MMWTELLQTHGYWVLALGCLLEGETVLLLAGFAAHRGLLDPAAVWVIAAASGFAGDQFYFWLGRRHGAQLLARWPHIAQQSERINRLLERWHELLIVLVRFAYGLRMAGPVLLGASTLPAWRFAVFNALGAALWALIIGAIGWLFGATAEAMLGEIRHIEGRLLLGLAAALVIIWIARWHLHRARRTRPAPPGGMSR